MGQKYPILGKYIPLSSGDPVAEAEGGEAAAVPEEQGSHQGRQRTYIVQVAVVVVIVVC